jgi:hypothetical protein
VKKLRLEQTNLTCTEFVRKLYALGKIKCKKKKKKKKKKQKQEYIKTESRICKFFSVLLISFQIF